MACESAFLNLPRELRDDIYRFYFAFENGLVYNFAYGENAKPKSQNILEDLAPSNKRDRIDLALRSTCKKIHEETEGLILKFNTITFSNTRISRSNSDEVRVRAARFHYLRVPLTMEAASFLYYEDDTVVRPCYTSSVVDVSHPPPRHSLFSRPGQATVVVAHILITICGLAGGRTYSTFDRPIVTHSPQKGYRLG